MCVLFLFMTRGHLNVMLVLQSCTDPVQVLPGSSCETFPSSSGGTHDGNIKFGEYIDVKEEKLIVKGEMGLGSEEEECMDVKDEEGIHIEEEEEEEGMCIEEEEDIDIKRRGELLGYSITFYEIRAEPY